MNKDPKALDVELAEVTDVRYNTADYYTAIYECFEEQNENEAYPLANVIREFGLP